MVYSFSKTLKGLGYTDLTVAHPKPNFYTRSFVVHVDAPGYEHPPIVMIASRRELPLDLGRVKPRPALGELLGL
jgi:hypothetical protein